MPHSLLVDAIPKVVDHLGDFLIDRVDVGSELLAAFLDLLDALRVGLLGPEVIELSLLLIGRVLRVGSTWNKSQSDFPQKS